MCFLYATPEALNSIVDEAIEHGHHIVAISERPNSEGKHIITTIPPGDPTW